MGKTGVFALQTMAILLLAAYPGFCQLPEGSQVPDFPGNSIWLSGQAHSFAADLKGKVVLVDFWEYTCINCIRTFPHLKELYRRYHPYGFEIVGVHKGEFAFASDLDNVKIGYSRMHLPYPAIADIQDSVWNRYKANSWPLSFLIDGKGTIREVHEGEGDYGKLEKKIQDLLKELHPADDFSKFTIAPDISIEAPGCGTQSEETYIGDERGGLWGGKIANPEGFHADSIVNYKPTGVRVERGFFASGPWRNNPDDFESVKAAPDPENYLGITYHAADVYAVFNRPAQGGAATLVITRDGKPIPKSMAGKDLSFDARGRSIIKIVEARMYYLVTKEDSRNHELRLYPQGTGARICSFTFGNKCQADFSRL
jgi:thiol-disulfide isomerase/thioredoxin